MLIKSKDGQVWSIVYHKLPRQPGCVSAIQYNELSDSMLQMTGIRLDSEIQGRATKAAIQAATSRMLERIRSLS